MNQLVDFGTVEQRVASRKGRRLTPCEVNGLYLLYAAAVDYGQTWDISPLAELNRYIVDTAAGAFESATWYSSDEPRGYFTGVEAVCQWHPTYF